MLKYLIVLSALCVPTFSYAVEDTPEYYFKFGTGLNNSGVTTKIISFGRQSQAFYLLEQQIEGGVYIDNSQAQGIIGYGSYELGFATYSNAGFYAKFFVGPGFITQTDSRLSSIFEFNEDIEFGLSGNNGVSIGAFFHHMSNAGLVGPNLGRDFMGLKIQIPLK